MEVGWDMEVGWGVEVGWDMVAGWGNTSTHKFSNVSCPLALYHAQVEFIKNLGLLKAPIQSGAIRNTRLSLQLWVSMALSSICWPTAQQGLMLSPKTFPTAGR
jgi:hypothetical protein